MHVDESRGYGFAGGVDIAQAGGGVGAIADKGYGIGVEGYISLYGDLTCAVVNRAMADDGVVGRAGMAGGKEDCGGQGYTCLYPAVFSHAGDLYRI